ncbi:MAG: dephospho-CoA kinase, partial [Muribaculaceae bacterium]|nr:dephospho-CoA kinase [Muribaculaceae bacterium]
MMRIAIAGGIGAGKSVVSRVMRAMGYEVYDSDSEARNLMDRDRGIIEAIRREVHEEAVDGMGRIDRAILGTAVFADEKKRLKLNRVVHSAVREDFRQWCTTRKHLQIVFVECAILCESGLADDVDAVWEVTAPDSLRIERVCVRNSLTPEQVLQRIAAQRAERESMASIERTVLVNDGVTPMLPQIETALNTAIL